jgi:hypothetical protein
MGVFCGTYYAYTDGRLSEGHRQWLVEELSWFGRNLPAPRDAVDPRAVFWFRPTAGQPLSRMWVVVRLLEDNGLPVHVHRTRRPGIIVYEDDYQVAAQPWRDTFNNRVRSH